MTLEVRRATASELATARSAATTEHRWQAAERAHILSQPWPFPHVRVHATMLLLGFQARDHREVLGQVIRLVVAGPGSASGRYPAGNTGRSNVPMTKLMPLLPDLQQFLAPAALRGEARRPTVP